MRSEYWSWTPQMRDAHLWLSHAGRLVMSWGWAGRAYHLLCLRDLEDALGKSDAVILVLAGEDDDREVYRMWADPALDVVVVAYRGYIGIFGPSQCGVRRELRTALAVETPGHHWWVSDADGVVTAALAWRDVLTILAAEQEEEEV